MCSVDDLERRIADEVLRRGGVAALDAYEHAGDAGACLKHFCEAVHGLLKAGLLRANRPFAPDADPAEVLDLRLQSNRPPGVPAKPVLLSGDLVYFPDRILGRGSASVVYAGEDRRSHQPVAVKVLELRSRPPEELRAWFYERFRQEPCILARIDHPHVVDVVAWGETDGTPWFAMELIEGGTLLDRLRRERRIPPAEVRDCLRGVAGALGAAAAHGIHHRDVKPGNIFVSGWKLADFNIAKVMLGPDTDHGPFRSITQSGARVGTPAYVAPERAMFGQGDFRSDIYSLGATAYHAATGKFVFNLPPDDGNAWAVAHRREAPVPVVERVPGFPPALAAVIHRCLAKEPEQRYGSFEALLNDLD